MRHRIAAIPGHTIGKEVVPEGAACCPNWDVQARGPHPPGRTATSQNKYRTTTAIVHKAELV